jgi:hypothetical protein
MPRGAARLRRANKLVALAKQQQPTADVKSTTNPKFVLRANDEQILLVSAVQDAVDAIGDLAGQSAVLTLIDSADYPVAKTRFDVYRQAVLTYGKTEAEKRKAIAAKAAAGSQMLPPYFGRQPTIVCTEFNRIELLFWIEADTEILINVGADGSIKLKLYAETNITERIQARIQTRVAKRLKDAGFLGPPPTPAIKRISIDAKLAMASAAASSAVANASASAIDLIPTNESTDHKQS